jgi:hypothetical protein
MVAVYAPSWHACPMQKFLLSKHGAHGPVLATSTQTVS